MVMYFSGKGIYFVSIVYLFDIPNIHYSKTHTFSLHHVLTFFKLKTSKHFAGFVCSTIQIMHRNIKELKI